ncbi:MAG: hypothetical protein RI964_3212 [Pseudomonadota bacterium]|jgi:hypothetical protein
MNPDGVKPSDLPLRDIHLPDPIGWWPLAPGWWLVLLAGVAILGLLVWWLARRQPQQPELNLALRELEQLQAKYQANSKVLLRELSVLLRRVAISHHGRERVSGLTGEAWVDFLDQAAGKPLFKGKFAQLLTEFPYRPEAQVETAALAKAIREWIKLQRGNNHV